MSTDQLRVVGTGSFFLLIFLSGFWLSRSGKPYSSIIFNTHKFVGLATGVFLIMTVYKTHQLAPLSPVEITAVVITVLIFVGTVAAGGLVSVDAAGALESVNQPIRGAIAMTHKLLPYLALLSTAATLYLLLSR